MRRSILTLVLLAGSTAIAVPAASALPSSSAAPGLTLGTPSAAKKRKKCDRNYRGRCLKPSVSDYDCAGGSGNGPYYVRGPFRVVGNDHYRLDADHDGIACER